MFDCFGFIVILIDIFFLSFYLVSDDLFLFNHGCHHQIYECATVSKWRAATSPVNEPPSSPGSGCSRCRWDGHPISSKFSRLRHEFGLFRLGYDALFGTQFRSGKIERIHSPRPPLQSHFLWFGSGRLSLLIMFNGSLNQIKTSFSLLGRKRMPKALASTVSITTATKLTWPAWWNRSSTATKKKI